MKIYLTYKTVDKPWGGANNFQRSLKKELVVNHKIEFVADPDNADIIFMNQVSAGPENKRGPYTVSDLKRLKAQNPNVKIIVRAVNVKAHAYPTGLLKYILSGGWLSDKNVLAVMHFADFVIFQSAYQKSFFEKYGFHGNRFVIIHNGASTVFSENSARPDLNENNDLVVLSSSIGTGKVKRHDLIAGLSLKAGVKVLHAGSWPKGIPSENVEMRGILDHKNLKELMSSCHYLYHPASRDACPNSLIEGLRMGLPVLYNPGEGSSAELAGNFGIPLDESDLTAAVKKARAAYREIANNLSKEKERFGIERAAKDYYAVFQAQMENFHG